MAEAVTERPAAARGPRPRAGLRLIEDIGAIVSHAADLSTGAERIVETVAEHLSMEVCSIYLFDRERQLLTLFATTGLDQSSVGRVTMGVDEGLTGIVVQTLEPVMAIDALAHPRYKYFPETGEERYHSFLGVPVVDRGQPVGVLIVQTSRRRRFTTGEVRLLKAIAVPVASVLTRMQLHDTLASTERERLAAVDRLKNYEAEQPARPAGKSGGPTRLYGLGASPGFGIGRAHLMAASVSFSGIARERQHPEKREMARLRGAVTRAIAELKRSKLRIQATVPEIDAAIFDAQQLMLQDESFLARIESLIRDGLSCEAALGQTVEEFVRQFGELDNDYFKDRASDIKDIGQRVLQHLLGVGERRRQFSSAVILVAKDVVLSDLAIVEQEDLRGVVLASGGVTSHASILAKSLEIP